jgi:hypothetical protein
MGQFNLPSQTEMHDSVYHGSFEGTKAGVMEAFKSLQMTGMLGLGSGGNDSMFASLLQKNQDRKPDEMTPASRTPQ